MTPAIVRAAEWAQARGYLYMASVVRQYKSTCYYHVVEVDEILNTGRWTAAYVGPYRHGGWGRHGVTWRNVPRGTCLRSVAMQAVR